MSKPYLSIHVRRFADDHWVFEIFRNLRPLLMSRRYRSRRGVIKAAESMRWGVDGWFDEHGRLTLERIGEHEYMDHARAKEAAGR